MLVGNLLGSLSKTEAHIETRIFQGSCQCSTELGRFANSSEECSDIFWGTEVLLCLGGSRTNKGTLRIHANLHFLKIFSGTNLFFFLNY